MKSSRQKKKFLFEIHIGLYGSSCPLVVLCLLLQPSEIRVFVFAKVYTYLFDRRYRFSEEERSDVL